MAENDAILNFAENLRKLLLTPPFRGFKILSIDPGFSHGCKLAVISESGDVIGIFLLSLQHTALMKTTNFHGQMFCRSVQYTPKA